MKIKIANTLEFKNLKLDGIIENYGLEELYINKGVVHIVGTEAKAVKTVLVNYAKTNNKIYKEDWREAERISKLNEEQIEAGEAKTKKRKPLSKKDKRTIAIRKEEQRKERLNSASRKIKAKRLYKIAKLAEEKYGVSKAELSRAIGSQVNKYHNVMRGTASILDSDLNKMGALLNKMEPLASIHKRVAKLYKDKDKRDRLSKSEKKIYTKYTEGGYNLTRKSLVKIDKKLTK